VKKVFIVVLNFNGKEDTLECLASVSRLQVTGYRLQVVVVDNGSMDGSVEKIKSQKLKIKNFILIENKENLGFAEGNNVGLRFALKNRADFVLVLNNDTFVDKNLIVELLQTAESCQKAGIFGPKIYFAPGFEFHRGRYRAEDLGKVIWYAGGKIDWQNTLFSHRGVDEVDQGQYGQVEETDFVSGCAMFVKREVIEQIGFFDKKFFAYLEDVDFCQRAKKAGFNLLYVPKALLWHKVAQTTGGIGSQLQDYYITRNRLLFGFRWGSSRAKFALLKESLKLLSGPKRQGVVDFYLRKFGM